MLTAITIFGIALFALDTALGGAVQESLVELFGDSEVFGVAMDYVSTFGQGILNSFSHFDLSNIFSHENIAFFVGVWALLLISRIVSVLKKG